ncbi:MAG: class II aldolase/adducin family protein [Candidatus Bathyarchaeia archaeon]
MNCVLHCHPPVATGLTLANVRIKPITLEAALTVARAPVAPLIYPGTKELGEAVAEAAIGSRVVLLQNHGAVTVGYDLQEALTAMENLEEAAMMTLVSRTVGMKPAEIDEERRATS